MPPYKKDPSRIDLLLLPNRFLNQLYNLFIYAYKNILENYTNNDLSKFRSFAKEVRELLPEYFQGSNRQEIDIGRSPIIDPITRDFYPERPSVYKRDEILYNEAKFIKQKYATEFVDGFIFKLHLYLTISPNQWYKIFIDFSDYPLKPTISIDDILKKELVSAKEKVRAIYDTLKDLHQTVDVAEQHIEEGAAGLAWKILAKIQNAEHKSSKFAERYFKTFNQLEKRLTKTIESQRETTVEI